MSYVVHISIMYPIVAELRKICVACAQDGHIPPKLEAIVNALLASMDLRENLRSIRDHVFDGITRSSKPLPDMRDSIYIDLYPFVHDKLDGDDNFLEKMHVDVAVEYISSCLDDDKHDYVEIAATLFATRYRFFLATTTRLEGWLFNERWSLYENISARIQQYAKVGFSVWLTNTVATSTTNTDIRSFVEVMARKLMNTRVSGSMASSVITLLHCPSIEERLSRYTHKISFRNGIIDLMDDYPCLRGEFPSDYSKMNTGIDYRVPTDAEAAAFARFLESVFPVKEEQDFYLDTYAHAFTGYNRYRKLTVHLGGGSNGKSLSDSIVKKAFGSYYIRIPADIFMKDVSSATAPTPALNSLKGCLIAVASEPDVSKKIVGTTVKSLTGNDSVSNRRLFNEQGNMDIISQIHMVANTLPSVDRTDTAYAGRLDVIVYRTTFIDKAEISSTEKSKEMVKRSSVQPKGVTFVREKIIGIEENILSMAHTFMFRIISLYMTRIRESTQRKVPESVTSATKAINVSHNTVSKYMNLTFKGPLEIERPGYVPMKAVYSEYKIYMSELHSNDKTLSMSELQEAINNIYLAMSIIETRADEGTVLLAHEFRDPRKMRS